MSARSRNPKPGTRPPSASSRITRTFDRLRAEKKKGFVAYLCAGDPSLEDSVDIALRLADAGADVIELGVPFSDPLADGKVNQMAATRALEAGATVPGVLDCAERIRARTEVPLILFTYLNPIHAYGYAKLARDASRAGVDGILALDLPVEESAEYVKPLEGAGLDRIFLVAPTSPDERIRKVAATGSGFIYCVSREGVTGMQQKISPDASKLLKRTRALSSLPIALGFGVSTPEQARAAVRHAEAVVVGSAIVNRFHEAPHTASGRKQAAAWVKSLVDAVKEG